MADALDVTVHTDSRTSELQLTDLVGMALRSSPRRAHLLVSTVLGKHLPTDPRVVYGAGRLLGSAVADTLTGIDSGITATGGALLHAALAESTDPAAVASELLTLCEEHNRAAALPLGTVVLGYAETATALGHTVADSLAADYLHSTRRDIPGLAPVGGFEEEHSHATSHRLLPEDPRMLARPGSLVLVDDELSTGQTVLNTIAALHGRQPRGHYVVASLVDLRSPADRARMAVIAAELGTRIDVVALAAGHLDLPADVLDRGRDLVDAHGVGAHGVEVRGVEAHGVGARWRETPWPAGLPEGGRHGFPASRRAELEDATRNLAAITARHLRNERPNGAPTPEQPMRVLVLGCEELMYSPLRIATYLVEELALFGGEPVDVRFSSTTRSPVLAVDDAEYAIRTKLGFPSHDGPFDGPGPRYAYNVASTDSARRFSDIVLVLDTAADTPGIEQRSGIVGQLSDAADRVHVLTLPVHRHAIATASADTCSRGAR